MDFFYCIVVSLNCSYDLIYVCICCLLTINRLELWDLTTFCSNKNDNNINSSKITYSYVVHKIHFYQIIFSVDYLIRRCLPGVGIGAHVYRMLAV